MYIWTLALNNEIIVQGRTWESWVEVVHFIEEWYDLGEYKRLLIYIHNLPYEFQFMHKWFIWDKVFSLKKRQPVSARTMGGLEFRCSYKLSGYSLAKLAENLTKHTIRKLKGDLDYSKIRNEKTPLTEEELQYTYNDVLIIIAYIDEYIERVGSVKDIPLTKTGEVRRFTRNYCFYNNGSRKLNNDTRRSYRNLMNRLVLESDDYDQLKRAFAGGFTHANLLWVNREVHNVYSYDFTSSYPYVMVSEQFPMSQPKKVDIETQEQLDYYLEKCCCLFDITFHNLKQSENVFENYISKSHCWELKGFEVNNGRIKSAQILSTTITEVDFEIISKFYTWDNFEIYNFKIMDKQYLPTQIVNAILDLYEGKTKLKGVAGKEAEYMNSKENINSMYGMTVTDICREEIKYGIDEWISERPNIEEAITKNNRSVKRFLYYPWGIWVTAYARRNLFTAIYELGYDYVYADTDSVKFVNYEEHKVYFEEYNKYVVELLDYVMRCHKIDPNRTRPKTIKGKQKQLGVWDSEGMYTTFKTLGAKRYMVEKENAFLVKKIDYMGNYAEYLDEVIIDGEEYYSDNVNITVSGVNKNIALPYLIATYGDDIFKEFKNELFIPEGETGKMIHTYIDNEYEGYVTDYLGNKAYYHEKSCIHLGDAEYALTMDESFLSLILDYWEV